MRSEDLIHRLAADLRPVRPARQPVAATALWLGVAAFVILVAVLVSGLRHDLAARLAAGFETLQLLTATATGILAAFAAFQLALPERDRRWALLPMPSAIAWLATMSWGCLQDLAQLGPEALRLGVSLPCLAFIVGLGAPLTVAMLWLARHAAWLRAGPVAALGGLSAAALASVGLSLIHHLDAALMVLVWHGLSVLVVAGLASMLGPRLMRRGLGSP
jgi:hypothetical protein